MYTTKEMLPSFDQVIIINDSKDFHRMFCLKTLELLEEFKTAYCKAIDEQQREELDSITHKIASTMKLLQLDEFLSLIRSYKKLSLSNRNVMEDLVKDVLYQSTQIEEAIRSWMEEL